MSDLKELIEELREDAYHWSDLNNHQDSRVYSASKAADRLEAIVKAWDGLAQHIVGRADSQYLRDNDASRECLAALRTAITGKGQ